MQQYMEKTRLGGVLDSLGLRLIILVCCVLWFIFLWGVTLAALFAGIAFFLLVSLAIRLGKRRTVARREKALRERIGGEIALDALPLAPPRQAHFQVSLWLTLAHPLRLERITEDGVLCRLEGELVLVRCLNRHQSVPVGAQDIIDAQRACLHHNAARCVLCTVSSLSSTAQTQLGLAEPPVKVVGKERLIRLAGAASPVTDEQLVALGARKKHHVGINTWLNHILAPHRSRRYFLYGLGLLLLYWITRLPYYPVPGVLCLSLALLSRIRHAKEDTI